MTSDPLVAIVDKEVADETIASLKAEDRYDANREIREAGADTLALPITEAPAHTSVEAVDIDGDPAYRVRDLDDYLEARGFSPEERACVPGSWAVLGTVILAKFDDCPREAEVGEAMLDLHGNVDTVLAHEGIDGEHREPSVRVVAGAGDTETIHHEHGTAYAMDLANVMFSPGNVAERVRMGEVVDPGEQVFDMFAGIGYFTLPMARNGAEVTATERNPVAFRYLLENAVLNDVSEVIDAYRADCRSIRPRVDRVVMGYYDAHEYLDAAVSALRPHGTIHLHDVGPADDPYERGIGALEAASESFSIQNRRIVKTHSPGMVHVVIDAAHRSG